MSKIIINKLGDFMHFLTISGSTGEASTNKTLLQCLAQVAPKHLTIEMCDNLINLPIFSPDLEGENTPDSIINFAEKIKQTDGIIISCPEYVHSIPGGLKNLIDWLFLRPEILDKPIILLHAADGGEDLLSVLRSALTTISSHFNEKIFQQFELRSHSASQIEDYFGQPENKQKLVDLALQFETYIQNIKMET